MCHIVCLTVALTVCLEIYSDDSSTVFLLFRILLVTWGLLWFHMNFLIFFSISVKNEIEIFIQVVLNLSALCLFSWASSLSLLKSVALNLWVTTPLKVSLAAYRTFTLHYNTVARLHL